MHLRRLWPACHFKISPASLAAERLGFHVAEPETSAALARILATFAAGYNLALGSDSRELVSASLRLRFDAHHVGFALEGAGMAYALQDLLTPWRPSLLLEFVEGPASDHDYIALVGAGLAVARVPRGLAAWSRRSEEIDPLVSWCAWDGVGFYDGIFRPRRALDPRREAPRSLPRVARPLYDAGLGRCLWWREGADPARIAAKISAFADERRSEMWCGIGIAAAYAGGVDAAVIDRLADAAGEHRADLFSGVPFATRMRQKGANPSPWTDFVTRRWLDCDCDRASLLLVTAVDHALAQKPIRERKLGDAYSQVRRKLVAVMGDA